MKITKDMVEKFVAELVSTKNFQKPSQEELEKKAALHNDLEGDFFFRARFKATSSEPDKKDLKLAEETLTEFKDSLKGSRRL